jgi:hypothetical protein
VRTDRLLACLALAAVACGPRYTIEAPPGFVRYEAEPNQLISADGVRLRLRAVDNDPEASLAFWEEALRRHLEERGYVLRRSAALDAGGMPGHVLDFVVPHGAVDHALRVALFVRGDEIVLVEAGGLFDRFQRHDEALARALATVRPR